MFFICKLMFLTFMLNTNAAVYIYYENRTRSTRNTKKSAKRCKVLVCAQANNELFNVTESKVI